MLRNVLIAEDDARWLSILKPDSSFNYYKVVNNVGAALIEIERDIIWDAAIFDRYLMADNLPFQDGKLGSEAGFVLAMAFQHRFPGRRMVIATGSPEPPPNNITEVLHPDLCIYIHKNSDDAVARVLRFLKGHPDRVRWSERLLKYLILQPNFCGLGVNLGLVLETLTGWAQNAATISDSNRQLSRMPEEERFVSVPPSNDFKGDMKLPNVPEGALFVIIFNEATGDALREAEWLEKDLRPFVETPLYVQGVDTKLELESVLAGLHTSVRRLIIAHIPTTDDIPYVRKLYKRVLAQDPDAKLAVVSEEAVLMMEETFGRDSVIGIFETPFRYADMLPALAAALKDILSKGNADMN